MRTRPSARLLVLDSFGRLLLFRFVHKAGPLAGQDFWATPGGGIEDGETFAQAAIRELKEETGIDLDNIGPEVARRQFILQLPDGENVNADERFFLVRVRDVAFSRDGWTLEEANVMTEHRWWTLDELAQTTMIVWPDNIVSILKSVTPE